MQWGKFSKTEKKKVGGRADRSTEILINLAEKSSPMEYFIIFLFNLTSVFLNAPRKDVCSPDHTVWGCPPSYVMYSALGGGLPANLIASSFDAVFAWVTHLPPKQTCCII